MIFELCESRGFDTAAIARQLNLVCLAKPEYREQGLALQTLVVRPNAGAILDSFYDTLTANEDVDRIISEHSDPEKLKNTQLRYLQSLGVDFDSRQYFEERLRVGSVHQRIGVPQSFYQGYFGALQCLLIQYIPSQVQRDQSAYEAMTQFIARITVLDMSLAIESYYAATMGGLQKSLESVLGERKRFQHLAVTDWLTSLHNHSYSRRFLAEALDIARTDKSPLCVVMADIDHFKKINDAHGHLVGDQVLRIAAARMLAGARKDDEIGRYGGEEFLLILQNTEITEAKDVAERVRARIKSDAMRSRNVEIHMTLSLGIAQARETDDVDTLIDRADAALYTAKLAGRDRVCSETQEQ